MQLAPAPTKEPKVPWYESRTRRLIVTSATQHETLDLCNRKWWLKQVRKLYEPPTGSQVFGTVLHGVAKRFLRGNDLGYDQHGNPINLYPPGWEVAHDDYNPGRIEGIASPAEQETIKRLISIAIENGVLERRPGRQIEKEFRLTVSELECPTCKSSGRVYANCCGEPGTLCLCEGDMSGYCDGLGQKIVTCPTCKGDAKGTHIQITGYIDYLLPREVQDHKTTKAMKWAKSANKLRENTQILIYAKIALEEARNRGEPIPEAITLRHNVYCNDPEDMRVRKTEVTVTRREIEDHWNKIIRNGEIMDHLRRNANAWHEIPDPPTGQNACNAYGGCAYRVICGGKESEEEYEQRTKRHVELNAQTGYNPIVPITPPLLNGVPMPPGVPAQATPAFPPPGGYGQPVGGFPPPGQAAPMQAGPPRPQGNIAPAINPPRPAGMVPQAPQGPPQQPQYPQPQQPTYAPSQPPPQPYPTQGPPPQQLQHQPQMGTAPQQVPAPSPQQSQLPPPPWFVPGCNACSNGPTPGFNSQGSPCRICDEKSAQTAGWISRMFDLKQQGNGVAQWTILQEFGNGSGYCQQVAPGQQIAAETRTQFTPQTAPPVDAEENGKKKGKAGRPSKSFELYINCVPERGAEERGDRRVFNFAQVLDGVCQEICRSSGVQHITQLDQYLRRDLLAQQGQMVAASFENAKVFACGIGNEPSDANALLNAILPLAGFVARGVATVH